jgi:hypothetical protein
MKMSKKRSYGSFKNIFNVILYQDDDEIQSNEAPYMQINTI